MNRENLKGKKQKTHVHERFVHSSVLPLMPYSIPLHVNSPSDLP